MWRALVVALFPACSNAADVYLDAPPPPVDQMAGPDAAPPLQILIVNEVAAGELPDWIEVVNATTEPLELSDFVYVDARGDFPRAKAFPAMTLDPGAYYAQDIDDAIAGFKLGSDEEVWVYRAADHALSDGVDWASGDSPIGMSYGRSPSIVGPFVTGAQSKGVANP